MKPSVNKIIMGLYKETKYDRIMWSMTIPNKEWTTDVKITKNKSIVYKISLNKEPNKTKMDIYLEKRYSQNGYLKSNLLKVRTIKTYFLFYLLKRINIKMGNTVNEEVRLVITQKNDIGDKFLLIKNNGWDFPKIHITNGYSFDTIKFCNENGIKTNEKYLKIIKYRNMFHKKNIFTMVIPIVLDDIDIELINKKGKRWINKNTINGFLDLESKRILDYFLYEYNDLPF
jgi:hypothetical protein